VTDSGSDTPIAPTTVPAPVVSPASAPEPVPAKRGRKRKELSEEQIKRIEALAAIGMTKQQVAQSLGLAERTYFQRQSENLQIAQAYARGQIRAVEGVAGVLLQRALAGDGWAVSLYLKNVAGFGERVMLEGGNPDRPLQVREVPVVTDEVLAAALKTLVGKREAGNGTKPA
jgi:hypothetical protein